MYYSSQCESSIATIIAYIGPKFFFIGTLIKLKKKNDFNFRFTFVLWFLNCCCCVYFMLRPDLDPFHYIKKNCMNFSMQGKVQPKFHTTERLYTFYVQIKVIRNATERRWYRKKSKKKTIEQTTNNKRSLPDVRHDFSFERLLLLRRILIDDHIVFSSRMFFLMVSSRTYFL